tara:strand:- start:231 stop:1193 length:963 start_codon:yes stop_codon:yes gene_type:complete
MLEADSINACAKRLDHDEVEKALNILINTYKNRNKIIITGVGKSGIVARKIAATFSSIGLIAIYLNPLDALHGDMGVISDEDTCILISNSGETNELIDMMPFLKKKCSHTISIVGKSISTLATKTDVFLNATVDREVCPLNLAPTASTSVAMAIGDSLAAVFMEREGISFSDFALNHPSGSLGKRLILKVDDVMISSLNLMSISPEDQIKDLIITINKNSIGCCGVEDQGDFIGLITDGDLRRALLDNSQIEWGKLKAKDIMTKDPITIDSGELAISAIKKMKNNIKNKSISQLPVMKKTQNKKIMIGIVRFQDLINAGI